MKIKMKTFWKNEFDFLIFHIKIRLYGNFHGNLRKKLTHFLRNFWLVEAKKKKKDENIKIWKNKFDFWIFCIKLRLYGNFQENLRKKKLAHFSRHFWLIEVKMKMKIKRFEKNSLIFEFSISKYVIWQLSWKSEGRKLAHFKDIFFWLIEAKLKMKMKKFGKSDQFLNSPYQN